MFLFISMNSNKNKSLIMEILNKVISHFIQEYNQDHQLINLRMFFDILNFQNDFTK